MTPAAPVGLAASAALSDLLSGPPRRGRVCGASGPACYLDVDGEIVVVEGSDGAGLPNAVRVAQPARPPLQLAVGDEVVLGRRALRIDDRELPVRRWWDPRVRIGSSRLDAAAVAVAVATLRTVASPPAAGARACGDTRARGEPGTRGDAGTGSRGDARPSARGAARAHSRNRPGSMRRPDTAVLADALRRRDHGLLEAAALDLLGRGPGLTPAGDDVLAGVLATLRVLGPSRPAPVAARVAGSADALAAGVRARARERTTALSAQLLAYADAGAVALPVGDVLRAVAGRGELVAAAVRLARVGHTSGGDLMIGIALAVDTLLPDPEGARL